MNVVQKIHWTIWISSICFSVLKLYVATTDHPDLSPQDFGEGFKFLNRPKDSSDFEWTVLATFLKNNLWVFFLIAAGSRFRHTVHLSVYLSFASSFFIVINIGFYGLCFFLIYIIVCCVIQVLGSKSLCYFWTVVSLFLLHSTSFQDLKSVFFLHQESLFLFEVGNSWLIAKCLSFSLDRINSQSHRHFSWLDITTIFSYALYWPTAFTGPILVYDEFIKQLHKESNQTLKPIIQSLVLLSSWVIIFEVLLHFIYSSAVQFYPEIIVAFDGWTLCGLGYALPLMFYLKYYILYGIPRCLSRFDGFEFPPPPKCISCIHSPSYLWRHFDRGLYLYILKYLYSPFMQKQWKLQVKLPHQNIRSETCLFSQDKELLNGDSHNISITKDKIKFCSETCELTEDNQSINEFSNNIHKVHTKENEKSCSRTYHPNEELPSTDVFAEKNSSRMKTTEPISIQLLHRLFGVFFSFAFVCVWHGGVWPIIAWSGINCFLVSTEFLLSKYDRNIRAVIGVPYFILMCISCIFFLSNWEVGMIFVRRILLGGWIPLIPLALVMYCGCHVSMDCNKEKINNHREENDKL